MASLSLGKTLASVMRRGVPEQAFEACAAHDRLLLENVAHLAQQAVPELDVTRATVKMEKDVYVLRIPASTSELTVDLSQLRDVEAYSPFRIVQVGVKLEKEGASVVPSALLVLQPSLYQIWPFPPFGRTNGLRAIGCSVEEGGARSV